MRILHVGYGFRPWRQGGLIAYAEDVMEAQASRGDHVAYFFRGRHYPMGPDDRLRRWRRDGVEMREVLNSTLNFGGDSGTLTPEADLAHAPSEAAFRDVLNQERPQVVHVQELIGLPTSLLDIAQAHGVPVVATLHDYFPLCPVLKLFDVDRQLCHRRDVGAQCARCSAHAPAGRTDFAIKTAAYELRRRLGDERGNHAVMVAKRSLDRVRALRARGVPRGTVEAEPERSAEPQQYQTRRDVNVTRLSRVDALVAPSDRVAEIYADLGVEESRLRVIAPTLRRLHDLSPQAFSAVPFPIRFVSLNGIGSEEKGAEVIVGAVTTLHQVGLADKFTLDLYGYTSDSARDRLRGAPGVEVHGGYAPGELDRMLEGKRVGIVPSVWEEPYGLVGPELLAKGIPVIGNARGGIAAYTRDGETGWVNRGADSAGLAEIMRAIIDEPQQVLARNRWILEHRDELVKPFGHHLAALDAVYDEVAAAAGAG